MRDEKHLVSVQGCLWRVPRKMEGRRDEDEMRSGGDARAVRYVNHLLCHTIAMCSPRSCSPHTGEDADIAELHFEFVCMCEREREGSVFWLSFSKLKLKSIVSLRWTFVIKCPCGLKSFFMSVISTLEAVPASSDVNSNHFNTVCDVDLAERRCIHVSSTFSAGMQGEKVEKKKRSYMPSVNHNHASVHSLSDIMDAVISPSRVADKMAGKAAQSGC